MKLTNEEIAKVFALYLGCKMEYTSVFDPNLKLRGNLLGVCSYTTELLLTDDSSDLNNQSVIGHAKLLLTPLSNISDEHAIEVAKILYPDHHNNNYTVQRENNRVDVWFGYNCVHIYHDGSIKGKEDGWINYEVADQLREWGYMLPYKGFDLFELGIAINKTKTTH